MKFRVMWTESAEDQLLEAAVYIAYNTGNVENAREFKDKVIEETNKLDLMPDRGIIPRDRMIRKRGYRGLIIGNYIAFYKVYHEAGYVVVSAFVPLKSDYKRFVL